MKVNMFFCSVCVALAACVAGGGHYHAAGGVYSLARF